VLWFPPVIEGLVSLFTFDFFLSLDALF
jgi:hypothetical protein